MYKMSSFLFWISPSQLPKEKGSPILYITAILQISLTNNSLIYASHDEFEKPELSAYVNTVSFK